MLGDTRFTTDDVEELFSNVTHSWLTDHPYELADETKGMWSNWDGIVSGWLGGDSRERYGCVFAPIIGQCYRNGRIHAEEHKCCEAPDSCPNNRVTVEYNSFPYGMPTYSTDVSAYRKQLAEALKARTSTWNVLVFSLGLIVDNFAHPVEEAAAITTAILEEAKSLIWRSALPRHHPVDGLNSKLIAVNTKVMELLKAYPRAHVFDTSYMLASLRPDRTAESFSYRYRNSKQYCNESQFETNFLPNCVRKPDWPLSVTKAMTLALLNYMINSEL